MERFIINFKIHDIHINSICSDFRIIIPLHVICIEMWVEEEEEKNPEISCSRNADAVERAQIHKWQSIRLTTDRSDYER